LDPGEIRRARERGAVAVLDKLDQLGDVLETVKRLHPQPNA
jgi:hypothetical protein